MSLDLKDTVKKLKKYKESPSPILTIYFQIPSGEINNEVLTKQIKTLIDNHLSSVQRSEIKKNIEYIEGFIQNYKPKNDEKTLIIFTGGDNLFEVLHLSFETDNYVKYAHDPYFDPLLNMQEKFSRYFIILIDRKKAIFFTLYFDSVESREMIVEDTVPQNVKGRWYEVPHVQRDDKVQRHIQDHMDHYFDYIALKAKSFIGKKFINGVIIGGHSDQMTQFEKHLSRELREKVIGRFVSELNVNFNKIIDKSIDAIRKLSREIVLTQTFQ